jgi:aldose 1-epimerase
MKNANGVTVNVTNYGGAIVSLAVPGKDGNMRDVVLGFDSLDGYLVNKPFLGVLVGRVANRIGNAKFTLDGKEYKLEANDGANHLHGGSHGFNTLVWDAAQTDNSIILTLYSPDGDSGYPGDVTAKVTYTLTDANAFRIDYHAETSGRTVCNLTNHSYFNLQNSGEIYKHELQINADYVTAVGDDLIPTGELKPVKGTAYDFNSSKLIGCDIENVGLGYDDNFVITSREDNIAAVAYSPESGITMTVKTNSPGIQLYTGNFLDGTAIGKNGVPVTKHSAFCPETQFFPDSINQPAFTPCILEKGKPQDFFTEFTFGVK